MRRAAILTAMLLLALFAGRADAQTFPGPSSPALARIYFYRTVESSLVFSWTSVWLNDAKVGDLGEHSYFFRDVQPGGYKVGVKSDVPYPEQYRDITVAPGSTTYIQVYSVPGYGIQFSPGGFNSAPQAYIPTVFGNRVMDPATAQREMSGLSPAGG